MSEPPAPNPKDLPDPSVTHSDDSESFGPFVIYPPDGVRTGLIITYRNMAVPGMYADRNAAHFACGYLLGGEQYGPLDDAWDRARGHSRDIIAGDVLWLQEDSEKTDRKGIDPQGTPVNLTRFEPSSTGSSASADSGVYLQHVFRGGPWDGRTKDVHRVFGVGAHCMPNPDGVYATWGEPFAWPAGKCRYVPLTGPGVEPVMMVWSLPGNPEQNSILEC